MKKIFNTLALLLCVLFVNAQAVSMSVNCPNDITVSAATGASSAIVNYNIPTASTTCTGHYDCNQVTDHNSVIYMGEHDGSKYYCSTSNMKWQDAKQLAISVGGHLAVINNAAENAFIKALNTASNHLWLGYSDYENEGTFLWYGDNSSYHNWGYFEPNNFGFWGEDYVILDKITGFWNDVDAYYKAEAMIEVPCPHIDNSNATVTRIAGLASGSAFPIGTTTVKYRITDECNNSEICEFNVTVQGGTNSSDLTVNCPEDINVTVAAGTSSIAVNYNAPTASTTCVANYDCSQVTNGNNNTLYMGEYNGSKYFCSLGSYTWQDALDFAASLGGHLVVINDAAENAKIKSWVNGSDVWIGYSDYSNEGTFNWYGDNSTYTNWATNEPNNANSSEDYACLIGSTGLWNDMDGYFEAEVMVEVPCPGAGGNEVTISLIEGLTSGANFPVGTTQVKYQITDECGNSETCAFNVNVTQQNPPVDGPDCDDITVTTGEGTITVSGLDGAPVSSVQIFNSSYQQLESCFADCNATMTYNVSAGTYFVFAKYFSANYQEICSTGQITVTVMGGSGPVDTDNDGTPDDQDCQPNNPAYPATPGTPCNDGNPNTTNDVVQADGCSCAGTPVDNTADCDDITVTTGQGTITVSGLDGAPVSSVQIFDTSWSGVASCFADCGGDTRVFNVPAGNYLVFVKYFTAGYQEVCSTGQVNVTVTGTTPTDSDNDGTPDSQDCQPLNPAYPATPGTACNDGDANTINDVVQADGCSCAGTPVNNNDLTVNCPSNITVSAAAGASSTVVNYNLPTATTTCTTGHDCSQVYGNNNVVYMGQYNGSKYFCSLGAYTWTDAQQLAANIGGYLAVVNDAAENNFIASLGTASTVWIGYSDQNTEGVFEWYGDDSSYTNWATGEPNNYGGVEDYAYMFRSTGKWNDVDGHFESEAMIEVPCPSTGGDQVTISLIQGLASGANFPVGTTQVKYQITDQCGNSEICTFDVNVIATMPTDTDNDGTPDDEDCQPNNPVYPATPGTACDDGNPNTINDVVQADGCTCEGTPIIDDNPDCSNVTITGTNTGITITGLDGAPVTSVQIFNSSYQQVESCFGNCASPVANYDLPAGNYFVYVKYFTASYQQICSTGEQTVTVGGSAGESIDLKLNITGANTTVSAGNNFEVIVTVMNEGVGTATDVFVSVPQPANVLYQGTNPTTASQGAFNVTSSSWNVGTLAPGQSATLVIRYTASSTVDGPYTVYGQVSSATGNDVDSTPGNGNGTTPNEDDEAVYTTGNVTCGLSFAPNITNIACNDNGTADDASDDTFTFDLTVNASGTGAIWGWRLTSAPGSADISYGESYSSVAYPISAGTTVLSLVDVDNATCTFNVSVTPPSTCSNGGGNTDGGNTGGTADCSNINVTSGNASITITGLDGAPVSSVQILNGSYQPVASLPNCFGDCGATKVYDNVPAGTYYVFTRYFTASYQEICSNEPVTVVVEAHSMMGSVREQSDNAGETVTGANASSVSNDDDEGAASYRSDKRAASSEFGIYPNPATNVVNINLEKVEGEAVINVYDQLGRVVERLETGVNTTVRINTTNYNEGIYIISVQNGVAPTVTKQFVILPH